MNTSDTILAYVENGLWLTGILLQGIEFDWGTIDVAGESYEVYWSYDGDEHWSVIDTDIDRCLTASSIHLVQK